jgi:hypothetical protein
LVQAQSKTCLFWISIGADIEKRHDSALVNQLNELLEKLDKEKLIHELHDGASLDDGSYWHSKATWRHGLFYFKGGIPKSWRERSKDEALITSVIYVAWTTIGNAIVLLVGSPNNVLGGKVAPEGIFIPGTSGAVDDVRALVDSLRTDELDTVIYTKRWEEELANDIPADIEIGSEHRYIDRSPIPLPGSDTDSYPLSLAQFCLNYFSSLPQTRLETVFRVLSVHMSKCNNFLLDLEKYSEQRKYGDWTELRRVAAKNGLGSFSKVLLCSPIYTALA